MSQVDNLIQLIKKKKELSGIDDSLIRENINNYLEKHKIPLTNLRPSELKVLVKELRSRLRENVGMFLASKKNRYKLLENDKILSLLKTHSSTKERIDFYPILKEVINRLNVKSILDLGCGINPIVLAKPGIEYFASDVNLEDLKLVDLFFKKKKLSGKTFVCDLNKIERCNLPNVDLTLILKVFDIVGKKDYEIAKNVLEKINSKHLIVSFPTITLSGRPMNSPRRVWFEKLLGNLLYKFEVLKSKNEIFYVV